MRKLLAAFAAVSACLALATAPASAAPSVMPHFTVTLMSVIGSGCPPGTTAVSAPSDTIFTVTYSQYIAQTGGSTPSGAFRKNCQLNVRIGVPAGLTYGIVGVDYRGYARLGRGAGGDLDAGYYFSGVAGTLRSQPHHLSGARDDDYEFNDRIGVVAWAPCRFAASLNINTAVKVSLGLDPSFVNQMTMDSTDVSASTRYHLAFREC